MLTAHSDPRAFGFVANTITVNFGQVGDFAIVGDWNGDGIDTPGVFTQSNSSNQDTTLKWCYLRRRRQPANNDAWFPFGVVSCDFVDRPLTWAKRNDPRNHTKQREDVLAHAGKRFSSR